MDSRLRGIYTLSDLTDTQEQYLQDLHLQCVLLEERIRYVTEAMPVRQLFEDYIASRDELEYHSIKNALQFRKK